MDEGSIDKASTDKASTDKEDIVKQQSIQQEKKGTVQDLIQGDDVYNKLMYGGYNFIKNQKGGRMVNKRHTNSPFYSSGFDRANNRKFYKMISPYPRTKGNFDFLNTFSKVNNKKRKHRIPYAMTNIHGYTQSLSHGGIVNAVLYENIHPGNIPFTLTQVKIFDDLFSTIYWQTFRQSSNVTDTATGKTFRIIQLLTSMLPKIYIYDQSKDIENYTINYKKMSDQIKHENPSFNTESRPEYFINEDRLSQITMQIVLGNTRESLVLQKY